MFLREEIEILFTYLTIDQSFISRIVTKHQEILKNSTVQLQNTIASLVVWANTWKMWCEEFCFEWVSDHILNYIEDIEDLSAALYVFWVAS